MVIAMIYRSYLVPLAIVAAAATGSIGATILLYLTDTAIDAQSLFGSIVIYSCTFKSPRCLGESVLQLFALPVLYILPTPSQLF